MLQHFLNRPAVHSQFLGYLSLALTFIVIRLTRYRICLHFIHLPAPLSLLQGEILLVNVITSGALLLCHSNHMHHRHLVHYCSAIYR